LVTGKVESLAEVNGLISTIQKYSTKDGPGLRSTVFLVGCNLKCKWCANPELIGPETKVMYFDRRCKQCGACVSIAAHHSIEFFEGACKIDREKCTNLVECMDICPYEAYEKVGYTITPVELYKKLKRDEVFYATSSGGVTFSGGEPGLQDKFVFETSKLLRMDGIHVALDTAGMLSWNKLDKLLDEIDLVLYDIKAFNPNIHKKCTETDNKLILENAKRISEKGKPIIIRMVIVPQKNDDIEDIEERLKFIKSLGDAVRQVDILKYHKLGSGKYYRLGLKYQLENTPECKDPFIEVVKQMAIGYGLNVKIDG
jgi:pyruvate formate lyase activating enzyme